MSQDTEAERQEEGNSKSKSKNNESTRNRSVVDYDSEASLRRALLTDDASTSTSASATVSASSPISPSKEENSKLHKLACSNLDWVLPNLDHSISEVQSMKDELHRLLVLKSYLILDNEREESFERITALGARIFEAPICLVSLVDLGRQWFMSNRGLGDVRETPRRYAFCAHAIQLREQTVMVVPDATSDPRFVNNPLVTGAPHIRFYAGAPLVAPEGYKLGTLCIIDTKTRPGGLTDAQKETMVDLAAMTVKVMVDRRNQVENREDPARLIAYTAHDLMTPLTGVQLSLSLLSEDEEVRQNLNHHQLELLTTASSCSDLMIRICETAIDSLRQKNPNASMNPATRMLASTSSATTHSQQPHNRGDGIKVTRVVDLVKSLQLIMEPIPKKVPLIITLDPTVPHKILSDDLKLFRSALNLVSNATSRTRFGKVHLRIYSRVSDALTGKRSLVFECEDTGEDIPVEEYQYLFQPSAGTAEESNVRLGLSSVASLVTSQGGEYGFRPRAVAEDGTKLRDAHGDCRQGSFFWFSVPLLVINNKHSGTYDDSLNNSTSSLGATIACEAKKAHFDAVLGGQLVEEGSCSGLEGRLSASSISNASLASHKNQLQPGAPRPRSANMPHVPLVLRSGSEDSFSAIRRRKSGAIQDAGYDPLIMDDEGDGKVPPCVVAPDTEPLSPVKMKGPRKKRALVIEDSLVVRKSLARALDKLGFEVDQAVNGLEGLRHLKETLFDMVLCDFLMPVMDGLDCVKQYRVWETQNRPHFVQHIIGISAHISVAESGQGLEAGMNDFRPKPISIKTLTELQNSDAVMARTMLLSQMEEAEDSQCADEHQEAVVNRVLDDSAGSEFVSDAKQRASKRSRVALMNHGSDEHIPVALIAMDTPTLKSNDFLRSLESVGWKLVVVHDGKDVLRLLQMRNWDVVLIDDDIPSVPAVQCIEQFREWEMKSRINEQRDVFLVCNEDIPDPADQSSIVQPPCGFNGVLRKPIVWHELNYLIQKRSSNLNILVRK